jgi:hypothetical protein
VITFVAHWPQGFTWSRGGWEYPLFWGLILFAIALRGGGPYSVDRKTRLGVVGWGNAPTIAAVYVRFCRSRANGLWCPDWAESPDSARRAVNFPIGRFDTPPFPPISAHIWFCGPVRLFPASLNPASPRPPTTCRRRDPAGGVRLLTRNGYDWTARALGRRSYHPFYFTAIFSLPLVLGQALR